MPWAAAATVGSALLGASSSRKARKAAEADARARREDAEATRRLGQEQNEWFKGEYDRTAPTRDAAVDMAQQTGRDQYQGMQYSMAQAREAEQRRKGIFEPLEDKVVQDAFAFDDAARGEQLAGEASADVNQAFAGARGQGQRSLTRMGVNPNSGAFAAMTNQNNLNQALALAQGQTGARRMGRDEGLMRRMNALQLGQGLRSAQMGQQQLATGQGNAAVANTGSAIGMDQSGAGLRQAGFGGMMQAYGMGNQSNQLASQNQNVANHWKEKETDVYGSALAGLGSAAAGSTWGVGDFSMSDKNKKKNTEQPADTESALDEVMATPVRDGWEYDEAKGAPKRVAGKKHIGPMAQDVQKHMGDKAAPNGEVIDFIEVNGKLMASMQELAKRVKQLEAAA